MTASVTAYGAGDDACQGVEAVIHLGGISTESSWDRILDVNINGTYTVFEAARRAGVPRVVFASSNHAVGFTPRSDFPVADFAFPAPDTYYGASKAAGEATAAPAAAAMERTRTPCASCPASSGPPGRGCCPPGCRRTTRAACSRRA